MNTKYNVIVKKPGKMVFFRNRKIRSPFILEIDESEINLVKSAMISGAVTESEYSIELITDDVKEETWEDIIIPEKEEVVIEDLVEEEEPKTLLEKLLRDDENGE